MDCGEKIARLRHNSNMTQEELAEAVHVSRDLVSKWENNKRRPDRRGLERLSNVFGVNIDCFEPRDERIIRELSQCISDRQMITVEGLNDLLNTFLENLPKRDADIFVRRYYFCDTAAEIAYKYGLSDVYVRVVLSRTRKKLKKHMERMM